MPRIDTRFVSKRKQDRSDRPNQRGVVAAGQIRPADAAGKQRIADEQIEAPLAGAANLEAHTARAMPRGVVHTHFELAERNLLARSVVAVDGWQVRIDVESEQTSLLDRLFVQKLIVPVEMHGCVQRALGDANARHVIHMRMGEQDVRNRDAFLRDELEEPVHFIARVDQHALPRASAGDDEAVLVEGGDGLSLDYDHSVILAILDDLLFTSKIRAVAKHAGAEVVVARSAQSAFEHMRSAAPSLVILDLNNPRTDPIGTVTAMKADPSLASIPTVGFVSHVDTETIVAARAAGVDEVLARSAFVNRLPELLSQSHGA